jgi:acetyltransferase-like isoleucine patch superfamily enzyme
MTPGSAPIRSFASQAHVASGAVVDAGAVVAPGAVIHGEARIGRGARIGSGTVVHAGTEIGEGCVVEDQVVLGKRPRLRAGSSAAGPELEPLVLAPEVTVCCGAIVYAGVRIGRGAIIGDQAQVRERTTIGARSVVGRGSAIEFGVRVGDRVLIQTDVYMTAGAVVEDDVFLGPGVLTTNDDTMGRHPRDEPLRGPVFRRACRVGGGAVLVPGVVIGVEAFVAAGAVVTRDVSERAVVVGAPARVIRQVPDEDLLERRR